MKHGIMERWNIGIMGCKSKLESPAVCNGDENEISFGANTGFKAPRETSRWKVEDFLTGFI